MAAGNNIGSRSVRWTGTALLASFLAGSAFAGPIQGVTRPTPVVDPAPIEGLAPPMSPRWVSLSALGSSEGASTPRTSSGPRIPWTTASIDSIRVPIADPDWRLMPRVKSDAEERAGSNRRRAVAALAALRGDEPVAPGSVFSAPYADTASDAAASQTEHLDDDGNPVFAAPTKYFQDFEDGTVAREWRLAGLEEMDKFGRFAGPYRNSTQTLFVRCEPDTPYVVTFDLLFIAANLGDVSVSDLFSVEVDGQALLQDTFAVLRERNETFNGERDDFDRDIYKQVAVTFTPRGDGVVKIKFKSTPHGNPGGETWGLDNVHIDIAPKQTLGELTHDDASVIAAAGIIGQFGLGTAGGPFDTGVNYFRGDPSLRGNGPTGPTVPPNIPVPGPGAGVVMLAGSLLALRRRR